MNTDLVYGEVQDENYINVCVENCDGYPVNFADILDGTFKGRIK